MAVHRSFIGAREEGSYGSAWLQMILNETVHRVELQIGVCCMCRPGDEVTHTQPFVVQLNPHTLRSLVMSEEILTYFQDSQVLWN
jgi:hypothetical protein